MRVWALVLLCGASAAAGSPQATTVLYSENWNSGLGGWTVASTSLSPTVGWAADATPAAVVGTPSFVSAPACLNYNDGVDFDDGFPNGGTATSPPIALGGTTGPSLTFQCNFETETAALGGFDARFILVSNDGFVTWQVVQQFGTGGTLPCAAMGTWHTHTIALDPTWGTVQIQFWFESIDDVFNTFAGWFIDDLQVTVTGGGPPPPPPPPPAPPPPATPGAPPPVPSDDDDHRTHRLCGGSAFGWAQAPALCAAGLLLALSVLRRRR